MRELKVWEETDKHLAWIAKGKADTVILREPEASYALKGMQDRGEKVSIL